MRRLILFILLFSLSATAFGEEPLPNDNAPSGEVGVCNGIDPEKIPPEAYSPGMDFYMAHLFPTKRETILAANHHKIPLTIEDLCFIDIKISLLAGEVDEPEVEEVNCGETPNLHACNGGGVLAGSEGDGKRFLNSYAKSASIKDALTDALSSQTNIGYGDLLYHFHDTTPGNLYAKRAMNTSNTLNKIMGCTEEDLSKCIQNESDASIYLTNNFAAMSTPTEAIINAESDAANIGDDKYLGMGALLKHYTRPPGEGSIPRHQQLVNAAASNGGVVTTCDPTQPISLTNVCP